VRISDIHPMLPIGFMIAEFRLQPLSGDGIAAK
jgi:hypothetical protein